MVDKKKREVAPSSQKLEVLRHDKLEKHSSNLMMQKIGKQAGASLNSGQYCKILLNYFVPKFPFLRFSQIKKVLE